MDTCIGVVHVHGHVCTCICMWFTSAVGRELRGPMHELRSGWCYAYGGSLRVSAVMYAYDVLMRLLVSAVMYANDVLMHARVCIRARVSRRRQGACSEDF